MAVFNWENVPELVKNLDTILHNAVALMEQNEQRRRRIEQDAQRKFSAQNSEINPSEIAEKMTQRLESIYKEANSIDRELASVFYRRKLTDKVAYMVKTGRAPRQIQPEFFELKTVDDCSRALDKLKAQFCSIRYFSSYGEAYQPKGGLSGLFSAGNVGDTNQLIDLRETLRFFNETLRKERNQILTNSIKQYQSAIEAKNKKIKKQLSDQISQGYMEASERQNNTNRKMAKDLDQLFSDDLIFLMENQLFDFFKEEYKLNQTSQCVNGLFNQGYVAYDLNWINNADIKHLIKNKFKDLVTDGNLLFLPCGMSQYGTSSWLIQGDGTNPDIPRRFVNRLMLSMLSSVPVGQLVYTVVDPVRKGGSISGFYSLRQQVPQLFGNKIYTEGGEIREKIREISDRVTRMTQEKLGGSYHTIYDYASDHLDYKVQTELLLLFDFSAAMVGDVMADVLNIMKNGAKCGVRMCMTLGENPQENNQTMSGKDMDEIWRLSKIIIQRSSEFLMDGCWYDLHCSMDDEKAKHFLEKYSLYSQDSSDQGGVFSPLLYKIIFSKQAAEVDAAVAQLYQLKHMWSQKTQALGAGNAFPQEVAIGMVDYPASLFSSSSAYHQMLEFFGTEPSQQNGLWQIQLPMMMDLRQGLDFFLECPSEYSREILDFTHHVIWTFLSSLPVGKVNICVFDGRQRGNSIIPFLDFKKRCPDAFDEKIYTAQEDMYERLKKLNQQIDEFIQDKLGNRYGDFWEYNKNTPNRSEAATLLVLYDFPSGMDKRNLELLQNIVQNGKRCGVYVLICHNPEISYSIYDHTEQHLSEIKKGCEQIAYKNGRYCLMPYDYPVSITGLPSDLEMEQFMSAYVKKLGKIKRQGISFSDIFPKELFKAQSFGKLSIPVGIGDRDAAVNMVMGEGSSHHGLIAGATGSGKSTLLHTVIMSSMLNYSPDQLQLYLMDFKSGTEFKIYESEKLPHIRLLALDAMQEFGESILESLVQEMEHRAELFKEEGGGVTAVKDYVSVTGKPMPRILVIIDEFQVLFNDAANRKVAEHCSELAKRIVTEGRAFGIHLLMATQSMRSISNMTLISGIAEQMLIRVGLKCGESDIRYLFGNEDCGKIQTMMKGPVGTAVMNPDYTEKPAMGFRVAYLDDETQHEYLKMISDQFKDYPARLQVFEGKRTEKLLDYFRVQGIGMTDEFPACIHLGVPIKVAPPYKIVIDKKRKHNLLVCGTDVKMAGRIIDNYMISALLNRNALVYCADGDLMVDDETSRPFYHLLSDWSGRLTLAEDRGSIIRMIDDVYDEFQLRKKKNKKEQIFVIFKNLQFLDIVEMMFNGDPVERSDYLDDEPEQENGDFSDPMAAFNFDHILSGPKTHKDTMPVGDKLIKLMESGSMYGICFVVSALEYQTVKDSMCSYGNNVIKNFPERIVFSLSQGDAQFLLDEPSISGLRDNTVYFTDGVREKLRIKPYTSPDVDALKAYLSGLE